MQKYIQEKRKHLLYAKQRLRIVPGNRRKLLYTLGIREHRFSKGRAQRNARSNERQSQRKHRKEIKPKPKLEGIS